jgi:putative ABC transport system permease protein
VTSSASSPRPARAPAPPHTVKRETEVVACELCEIIGVAIDTFRMNKIRFALTALGMVIGTASLILVVTVGLTGKQYVVRQIQGIGANMIYAYHEGEGAANRSAAADDLTQDDLQAVREQVHGIVAASSMVQLRDHIPVGGGQVEDVLVLGVDPDYAAIRNLDVLAGRFFDSYDSQSRIKVVALTENLANRLYGSPREAIGRTMQISSLPFTVIGVFKERVNTFGQSELADDTIVIPTTVSRYFAHSDGSVDQLFFTMADPGEVSGATDHILEVLQSRHRPESVYQVRNLTELINVARRTANALTVVLLLVSMVTLIVSGIGIMNIMLATVTARTREIGIRKAIGATTRDIRLQFLSEAMIIALVGGFIGTLVGLGMPLSVRFLTEYRIPISGLSAIIAIVVSSMVGIIFGTVPAARAANMDPIESLRYD